MKWPEYMFNVFMFCSVHEKMAEKEQTVVQSQDELPSPSAGLISLLQDGLNFTPLDSNTEEVVQPFPRSPKLQRKSTKAAPLSQVKVPISLETDDQTTEELTKLWRLTAETPNTINFLFKNFPVH